MSLVRALPPIKPKYKTTVETKDIALDLNWKPMEGTPQEQAFHSEADILGFGGAAGGGKTSLICGLAATSHKHSLILRREYKSLSDIEKQLQEIISPDSGRYNNTSKTYRLNDGRVIELGAIQFDKDKVNWQGKAHDLLCFDEATAFNEDLVKFLMIWLRSTEPDQRCRCLLTFNPPVDANGLWIKKYFGAWVDKRHPDYPFPAGVLKWYATIDGKEIEVPNGDPIEHTDETGKPETIKPLSRTFIPAKLGDNKYLAATNYKAVLQSLPKELKNKMLYGDFEEDLQDELWQCIPAQWVLDAMERWRNSCKPPVVMSAVGVDPSRGGKDATCIALRYDNWIDEIVSYPGSQSPDGITVAKHVIEQMPDLSAYINVDAIGVGGATLDALKQFGCEAYGVVVSESDPDATDRKGVFHFRNKRAQYWWMLRELLDPAYDSDLCIPDDNELLAELTAPLWKVTDYKILIESKEDIRKRIGRSTDRADALILSLVDRGISYTPSFT